MTQQLIVKTDILDLQPSSKPYIMALFMGTKIVDMEPEKAGGQLYDIIKIAEFDSGLTKLNDEDLLILSKTTYDHIKEKYSNLTIEEFKTACKSGTLNVYGDWYGMCLKTIASWIKGYTTSEVRIKAIKEWNARLDSYKTTNVPVAAIWEFNKQGAINAFNSYKNSGRLPFGAFAYYDIINEMIGTEYKGSKTLITDPEERKRLYKSVKALHTQVAIKEKKLAEQKGNFENAMNLMSGIMDGFKGNVANSLKTAFLKSYFDNLMKQNKTLNL